MRRIKEELMLCLGGNMWSQYRRPDRTKVPFPDDPAADRDGPVETDGDRRTRIKRAREKGPGNPQWLTEPRL